MASVDQQLFLELKTRYPEVPDSIVTKYCRQVETLCFSTSRISCLTTVLTAKLLGINDC